MTEEVKIKTVETIESLLLNLDLCDIIEIVGNVLLRIGFNFIQSDDEPNENNIINIILQDKKKNGETLHNALAHQGLLMLMWIENIKK